MSIKVALLKSGEDVIADIQEMVVEDRVIGYFFNIPYTVKLKNLQKDDSKTYVDIEFHPWMPISKDKKIPVTAEWVVTIVEPIDKVKEMYEERILKVGESNND